MAKPGDMLRVKRRRRNEETSLQDDLPDGTIVEVLSSSDTHCHVRCKGTFYNIPITDLEQMNGKPV